MCRTSCGSNNMKINQRNFLFLIWLYENLLPRWVVSQNKKISGYIFSGSAINRSAGWVLLVDKRQATAIQRFVHRISIDICRRQVVSQIFRIAFRAFFWGVNITLRLREKSHQDRKVHLQCLIVYFLSSQVRKRYLSGINYRWSLAPSLSKLTIEFRIDREHFPFFDSSLNMAPSNITNVTMLYIKMCVFDYDLYRIILKVKVWLN